MKNNNTLLTTTLVFFLLIGIFACQQPQPEKMPKADTENTTITKKEIKILDTLPKNPPAKGFDLAGSDEKAIAIADEVMEAMGGRANWDSTHYLSWNFFGSRKLLWDKWTGNVRAESLKKGEDWKVSFNLNEETGTVFVHGEKQSQADTLKKYIQKGKEVWINDSYWLVMPFKLKDSGVTLKYIREEKTDVGENADVLQLTFNEVGVTPENRYEIWVAKDSKLITQWSFYQTAEEVVPRFVTPWAGYKMYGDILLSGNRGKYELTEIEVLDRVEEGAFKL